MAPNSKTYKAFVSSTFIDLKDHRAHVINSLRNAGFFVDPMENWAADSDEPKKFSQDRLDGCDLCVLLVAFRRGFIPKGETSSITQMEYEAALENGVDPLVFLLGDDAKWWAKYDERGKDSALEEWRSSLRVKHGVGFFTDDPHSIDVATALTRWLAKKKSAQSELEKIEGNGGSKLSALLEMVKVSKGPFFYGSERCRQEIDRDYWIDKYPVTNERYGKFILDNGYEKQVYWSSAGWKWKAEKNVTGPEYWNDPKWNDPDCPVVGVSYYEAEAYAKWTGKRLPTEQEWEKAARGEDGRQYPWRGSFDKNKCNGFESGIGHTTPVGQYPDGVSPYGCYDMAGNVSEWCASRYDGEQKDTCVIRSGAWNSTQEYLQITNRGTSYPVYRHYHLGFRLAQDIEP